MGGREAMKGEREIKMRDAISKSLRSPSTELARAQIEKALTLLVVSHRDNLGSPDSTAFSSPVKQLSRSQTSLFEGPCCQLVQGNTHRPQFSQTSRSLDESHFRRSPTYSPQPSYHQQEAYTDCTILHPTCPILKQSN